MGRVGRGPGRGTGGLAAQEMEDPDCHLYDNAVGDFDGNGIGDLAFEQRLGDETRQLVVFPDVLRP